MLEEENLTLKNKIVELKERLSQIYSHAAVDANRSKAFESEFSLYLKACEGPRKERMDGLRLQHEATKFGLVVLAVALAFAAYALNVQVLLGITALLGFGFIACGLMYLLLEGEISMKRATDYCAELEAYFMEHRWTSEQNDSANPSRMPLWEEYRRQWDKDLFAGRRYGEAAVYAPLRIALSLADILALAALLYFSIAHRSEISSAAVVVGCLAWVAIVALQMLLVNVIVVRVGGRLAGNGSPEGSQGNAGVSRPGTWGNMLRLFFVLDIIFPGGNGGSAR